MRYTKKEIREMIDEKIRSLIDTEKIKLIQTRAGEYFRWLHMSNLDKLEAVLAERN